ncbi:MAG: hypothetical protein WCV59_04010 [Parcubacteria group bacterium]|jgi:hypothetical protein
MKKLVIALAVIIVIGLLGFAAYKVFLAPKVPQAFIDSHNKIAGLDKEVEALSDPKNVPDFEKMINDKNYNGAIKATDDTLATENQALEKLKAINSELATLKSLSGEVTDAKTKEAVTKRITLGEKENATKTKYFMIRIQMLEKMKEMIARINKDEKLFTAADEKAVNDMSKQIDEIKSQGDKAKSDLDAAQVQYKTAEKEFMEATGLSVAN